MPDLGDVLQQLHDSEPAERARAIERAAVAVERLIHGVVGALEGAPRPRHELFEHIHRFGTAMLEPIHDLMERSEDRELRVLCALLLLRLRSLAGVDLLLGEIERGGPWVADAARRLAEAQVRPAAPRIVHRLRNLPMEQEAEIVALLHALQALEGSLPADLVERYSRADAPAEAQAIAGRAIAATTDERR